MPLLLTLFNTRWLLPLLSFLLLMLPSEKGEAIESRSSRQLQVELLTPAFRIDPLRFETQAIPGREVSFSFQIHAVTEPVTLQMAPVGLRQDSTGLIAADQRATPDGKIRLLGTTIRRLKPGQTDRIRGRWQIPADAGALSVAGLLVTQRPARSQPRQSNRRAAASVDFVSRYLLRLEAETRGRSKAEPLDIRRANLIDLQGFATVRATLRSKESRHVRVWARVFDSQQQPVGKAFPLGLRVRANLSSTERWKVSLISGGEVQVEARSPAALFPGEYTLQLTTSDDRGSRRRETFPVKVPRGAFPAQSAIADPQGSGLNISPRHVQLSLGAGGARLAPLRLHNRGAEPVVVNLSLTAASTANEASKATADPNQAERNHVPFCIAVRPSQVVIKPGRRRNIMVAYQSSGDVLQHPCYAIIEAKIQSHSMSEAGTVRVPVGVLPNTELPESQLALNKSSTETIDGKRVSEWTLANRGVSHLEPHAVFTWRDTQGQLHQLEQGYRHWLLPGEKQRLKFTLPRDAECPVAIAVSPTPIEPPRVVVLTDHNNSE